MASESTKVVKVNQEFIDELLTRIKYLEIYDTETHRDYLTKHKKEFGACCSTVPFPTGVDYDYTRHKCVYEKHGLDKDFCQGELFNFWAIELPSQNCGKNVTNPPK